MRKLSNKELLSRASIVFAFIVILRSAEPWFLWGDTLVGNAAILLFLCCRVLLPWRIAPRFMMLVLALYLFYVWMGIYQAERLATPIIMLVKRYLPLLFIVMMSHEEHLRLKSLVIKIFTLIIAVSIVAYVLLLCGFPLPATEIQHPNTWYTPFFNYYFFVTELNVGEFLRFRSVFTEPGHLGMFCALFLYINGYNLRKLQNVVLLLALILSLSLAAYILLFIGWFLYSLMSGVSLRRIMKMALVVVCFAGIGWLYINSSNGEVLQKLIVDRLEYDEKKGLKGNNRNTYEFRQVYAQLTTSEYVVGKGSSFVKEHFANTANSSYRNFVMTNGLVGLFLMLAFFFSVIYVFPSRLALGLFLLYAVSFIQRPYWLLEVESWMYLCAVPLFCNQREKFRI